MMFFNIPDIFHIGDTFRQGYESRYERKIGKDPRNVSLLEPLETRLFNLEDVRIRIGSRIEKEVASGTDMSIPMELLGTADMALDRARLAVAVATSTPTGPKPRTPYVESQTAYFALTQAKDALNAVVDGIIIATEQANSAARENIHGKKSQ